VTAIALDGDLAVRQPGLDHLFDLLLVHAALLWPGPVRAVASKKLESYRIRLVIEQPVRNGKTITTEGTEGTERSLLFA
jgi:hypothetical protein